MTDTAPEAPEPDEGSEAPFNFQAWIDSEGHATDGDAWEPRTFDDAEWAIESLANLDSMIAEAAAFRDRKVHRYEAFFESQTAKIRRARERLDLRLQMYGLRERAESGGKVKTFRFPYGEIATTGRSEARVDVTDDAAFIAWIEAHEPELLEEVTKQTRKVVLAAMREHFAAVEHDGQWRAVYLDGQPVDGLTVAEPDVTAKVRPTL